MLWGSGNIAFKMCSCTWWRPKEVSMATDIEVNKHAPTHLIQCPIINLKEFRVEVIARQNTINNGPKAEDISTFVNWLLRVFLLCLCCYSCSVLRYTIAPCGWLVVVVAVVILFAILPQQNFGSIEIVEFDESLFGKQNLWQFQIRVDNNTTRVTVQRCQSLRSFVDDDQFISGWESAVDSGVVFTCFPFGGRSPCCPNRHCAKVRPATPDHNAHIRIQFLGLTWKYCSLRLPSEQPRSYCVQHSVDGDLFWGMGGLGQKNLSFCLEKKRLLFCIFQPSNSLFSLIWFGVVMAVAIVVVLWLAA